MTMSRMAPATTSRLDAATAGLGLRERKKIKTRQAIRAAAYRLFQEQGYDATTVEQIAVAAEVSPSTFFRYFPTKEDVVLTDEYDPLMEAALRARPADEPVVGSVREAATVLVRELVEEPGIREEMLQRLDLVLQVPAIRARMGENIQATCDLLAQCLARRSGRTDPDLETRVLVGAMLGGWQQAMLHWAADGGSGDLLRMTEDTFDTLVRGFSAASA